MSTKYADRAFVSMNGTNLVNIQSASLRQNHNAKAVPSMTPDGFNRGFVQGNRDIDISIVIAVENALARPKFENIDYGANDVGIKFQVGVDEYIASGLFLKDNDDNAGGIGDEVKATFNFGALKVTDTQGNPVTFNIQLG